MVKFLHQLHSVLFWWLAEVSWVLNCDVFLSDVLHRDCCRVFNFQSCFCRNHGSSEFVDCMYECCFYRFALLDVATDIPRCLFFRVDHHVFLLLYVHDKFLDAGGRSPAVLLNMACSGLCYVITLNWGASKRYFLNFPIPHLIARASLSVVEYLDFGGLRLRDLNATGRKPSADDRFCKSTALRDDFHSGKLSSIVLDRKVLLCLTSFVLVENT